ncbi:MAG: hypothetical protein IH849_12080 [Acidobacteria bacterium]|nr:hypothetical protein [Acidobacteriota bacterium]
MRAADPVENSGDVDVVRIDRPAGRQHPTPVYAKRADDVPVMGTPLSGVDLRDRPAQLAQWLIVFGALGLLIGGAKWLNARQDVEPFGPDASSTATETTLQRGTVRAEPPLDASISPAPVPAIASTADDSGVAAAAGTAAGVSPQGAVSSEEALETTFSGVFGSLIDICLDARGGDPNFPKSAKPCG